MITDPFGRPKQTLTDKVGKEILSRITSGKWPAGYTLPSELELADLFDVSQGTVRRALRNLVDCGILIRQQGKGTFVASRKRRPVGTRVQWFVKNGDERKEDKTPHTQPVICGFELIEANRRVAAFLEIEPGSRVWHIMRDNSYLGLDVQCCFDDIYLPAERFPGLSERDIRLSDSQDIYGFYEEKYGISAFTVDEYARAVFLNPDQARKAGVTPPFPAICLQRITRDAADRPIELRYLTNATIEQNMVLSIGRFL
ncbi:MAG: GntR family transcriptional regulator [Sutterella sp.]|nr:GntR family transcriptional regulator [Sutterella sp.]